MTNPQILFRARHCPSSSPLLSLSRRSQFIRSPRRKQAFVHNDAVSQSVATPEEFIIPPIFDIFDAPSRLGQSTAFIQSTASGLRRRSAERNIPENTDFSLPRPPPSSLPPPIIFDGPARPKNLPLLASHRRVDEALNLKPAPARQSRPHHTHTSFQPHNATERLVEVFDGPARITRFSHRTSRQNRNGKHILLLGLAGAIGGTALSYTKTFS